MLSQLLKILTPEVIIQAIKDNPKLIMETIQRFETFKLVGSSLTPELQILVSTNIGAINEYLATAEGRSGTKQWAEGFSAYITKLKEAASAAASAKLTSETATSIHAEVTAQIRAELEAKLRKELEDKIRAEMGVTPPAAHTSLALKEAEVNTLQAQLARAKTTAK
jgi:hypothetical protein